MKTFQQFMEQHPTMKPNEYNKQVARQSARWKGMQIRQAHGEMEHQAGAEVAAKKARLKAIMSRWLKLGPWNCLYSVSNDPIMDSFDDIQIEEFSHFDFVEEMNEGLFDEKDDDKSFQAFLNSNWDFWQFLNCPLNHPHRYFTLYHTQMTETIANVLPHINELKDAWRKQDFIFTKQQQEEYDLLIATRRERVRQLYAEGRVFKGSYKAKEDDI